MFKGLFAGFTNQGTVPATNTIRAGRNEGGKGEIKEEITQLNPKKVFCTHNTNTYREGTWWDLQRKTQNEHE